MATFLELARMTGRESGTLPDLTPSSVVGASGREAKVVSWTRQAWTQLQNSRSGWRWMVEPFSGTVPAATARVAAGTLGITRLANWLPDMGLYAYRTSDGVEREGPLTYVDFDEYVRMFERGAPPEPASPYVWSISYTDELCFGPPPDAEHHIRGFYYKTPQVLAADLDVPEMPARYHDLIAWNALILLAGHDEAEVAIAHATAQSEALTCALESAQLPKIRLCAGGYF